MNTSSHLDLAELSDLCRQNGEYAVAVIIARPEGTYVWGAQSISALALHIQGTDLLNDRIYDAGTDARKRLILAMQRDAEALGPSPSDPSC